MQLAKLLTELTKKGVPFCWKEEHIAVLDKLINLIMMALILGCPDLEK
jgi:hypothetical protein